jgi:hypothetical protein
MGSNLATLKAVNYPQAQQFMFVQIVGGAIIIFVRGNQINVTTTASVAAR